MKTQPTTEKALTFLIEHFYGIGEEHNDFQEQSHKEGDVSSLSDVLETGKVAQKYYLTKKQCHFLECRKLCLNK